MANVCKATSPYFLPTTLQPAFTKFIRATNEGTMSADDVNHFCVKPAPPRLRQGREVPQGTMGKFPFTTLSTDPSVNSPSADLGSVLHKARCWRHWVEISMVLQPSVPGVIPRTTQAWSASSAENKRVQTFASSGIYV